MLHMLQLIKGNDKYMTKTIRAHHDADGITSAYFTSFGVKDSKIELWDGEFGDVTGLKKGDWMCDMRPNKDLKGLTVIDHHLPHMEEHEYELFGEDVPASLIAFNKFKEEELKMMTFTTC